MEEGYWVIFSGTPCQIAGLRLFLRKDYDKLILIDLICHGVGSRTFFQRCLENYESQYHSKVESYTFRSKRDYGKQYGVEIELSSGKLIYREIDDYNKLFLNQICLDSACGENCHFRDKKRYSDITIADFKGFNVIFPHIFDWHPYSTLIINSQKAEKLLPILRKRLKIFPCSIKDIEHFQACYNSQPPGNSNSSLFFADLLTGMPFTKLIEKYNSLSSTKKKTLLKRLWDRLPFYLRFTIHYFYRRIFHDE